MNKKNCTVITTVGCEGVDEVGGWTACFRGTAVWGMGVGGGGGTRTSTSSVWTQQARVFTHTHSHVNITEGHGAWALGSTSARHKHRHASPPRPRPAPAGLWSCLGDPTPSSGSCLTINMSADARQGGSTPTQGGLVGRPHPHPPLPVGSVA